MPQGENEKLLRADRVRRFQFLGRRDHGDKGRRSHIDDGQDNKSLVIHNIEKDRKRAMRLAIREAMLGDEVQSLNDSAVLDDLSSEEKRRRIKEKRSEFLASRNKQETEVQNILDQIKIICYGSGVEIRPRIDRSAGRMELTLNLFQIALGKRGELPRNANKYVVESYYESVQTIIDNLVYKLKDLVDQHKDQHQVLSRIGQRTDLNEYERQYLTNYAESVYLCFSIPLVTIADPGTQAGDWEPEWVDDNALDYDDEIEDNAQANEAYDQWLSESKNELEDLRTQPEPGRGSHRRGFKYLGED